jgi:hypothetical protein
VRNSRNSAPVRVGKYGVERSAMPRGLPAGSVSGIWGIPVDAEKRIVRGVEGWLK